MQPGFQTHDFTMRPSGWGRTSPPNGKSEKMSPKGKGRTGA